MLLTCWPRSKWILLAILFSGLLSAIRLLPPVLELADYQKKAIFNAVYGYPTLAHLVSSMVMIQVPMESAVKYFSLNVFAENYWDFNFYLGVIGSGFVLYFGLIRWLKETPPRWHQLILPVFTSTALAIGSTYWLVRITDIPLFGSERAVMRMISVPIVWLLLVGAILFQEWWNGRKFQASQQVAALMILVLMFIDLWSNIKVWRPSEIKQYFAPVVMNIAGNSVANHADPQYMLVLSVGLGITLVTAIFLIVMSWRESKVRRSQV
jgi:hypothetical protein